MDYIETMTVSEITTLLEAWAPKHFAESYDNVGLLVGSPTQKVTQALINLDVTEDVVQEARDRKCELIIAHHPIWFTARKRLTGEDYVSRVIIQAIKHDISIYALHTNLDNIRMGVNQRMAQQLGLTHLRFLRDKDPEADTGSGMIGQLPSPLSKSDFLAHVKSAFGCGGIRYADFPGNSISTVAICGGAGSFLTQDAIRQGADALVTADITYHKFFDNENQLLLLDIGHYESEQHTSEWIRTYILEKIPNFAVHLSQVNTNPVKYY